MARMIAFLRAINVGGHVVKMERLRQLFDALGFSHVETFIASGNVVFETKSRNVETLERRIEKQLLEALGYEVATFIRTPSELARIDSYKPFSQPALDAAAALNIGFLASALDEQAQQKLLSLRTATDDFHVHEREIYWLCKMKQSESKITNGLLERALGQKLTLRGANTITRMTAKYCPPLP